MRATIHSGVSPFKYPNYFSFQVLKENPHGCARAEVFCRYNKHDFRCLYLNEVECDLAKPVVLHYSICYSTLTLVLSFKPWNFVEKGKKKADAEKCKQFKRVSDWLNTVALVI